MIWAWHGSPRNSHQNCPNSNAYSPDLAPCDFFLLPKLNRPIKGRSYSTIEKIKAASKKELNKIPRNDFVEGFEVWKTLAQVYNIWWELLWRGQNKYSWINKKFLKKHKNRYTFWTHLVWHRLLSLYFCRVSVENRYISSGPSFIFKNYDTIFIPISKNETF